MSHEAQNPIAHDQQQIALTATEAYQQAANLHVTHEYALTARQHVELPLSAASLGHVMHENGAVNEQLIGLVRAGTNEHTDGEIFGLIRVSQHREGSVFKEHVAVMRMSDDEPTLVSFVTAGTRGQIGRANGTASEKSTSRNHFEVAMDVNGVVAVVDSESTHGTNILLPTNETSHDSDNPYAGDEGSSKWKLPEGVANELLIDTKQGLAPVVETSNQELIDRVPASPKDAEAMLHADQKNAAAQIENARNQRIEQVVEQLNKLEAPFGDADRRALWGYAAGKINKRVAQAAQNGRESINAEQQAGQAYRELSEPARQVADEYFRLMSQIDRLRSS